MLNEGMNCEERNLYSEIKHHWNIHSFRPHAQGTCSLYSKENKYAAETRHSDSCLQQYRYFQNANMYLKLNNLTEKCT